MSEVSSTQYCCIKASALKPLLGMKLLYKNFELELKYEQFVSYFLQVG